MKRMKFDPPLLTDFELEVLNRVWHHGRASVSQIQISLLRQGKEYAYTSVFTCLKALIRKKLIRQDNPSFAYIAYYVPVKSRDIVAQQLIEHFYQKIFV
jgi:predicted transcriptional regulator